MDNFDRSVVTIALIVLALIGYSIVGTAGRVDEIKQRAPKEMASRNWKILRYEGYQYGAWGNHGGKVWYHVANIDNPNIQYRVFVTLWDGELMFNYGAPERLERINITSDSLTIHGK